MFAWRKWRLYSPCNVVPRPRRSVRVSSRDCSRYSCYPSAFMIAELPGGAHVLPGKKDTSFWGHAWDIKNITFASISKCTSVYTATKAIQLIKQFV